MARSSYERWLEEQKSTIDKWLRRLMRMHEERGVWDIPATVDAVLSHPKFDYWDKVFAITRLVELVILEISERR